MRALCIAVAGGVLLLHGAGALGQEVSPPPAANQEGVAERVGESVDRGLNKLGQKIRKTWADFRKSVDELSVQGRVYARLHWDKALANAPIEITVQDENVVMLNGSVPNEAARRTAVALTRDTVGVGRVVDQLAIAPSTTTTPPVLPPVTVPQGR